ncbi:MAG: hypothetical protein ACKODS_01325 [Methylophilaceae bacterium]
MKKIVFLALVLASCATPETAAEGGAKQPTTNQSDTKIKVGQQQNNTMRLPTESE